MKKYKCWAASNDESDATIIRDYYIDSAAARFVEQSLPDMRDGDEIEVCVKDPETKEVSKWRVSVVRQLNYIADPIE